MIDFTRGFILYLIQHARRPPTKTMLMKLVYLADIEHYRRTGEQLTFMRWERDRHGPVDYAVLRHAEQLAHGGIITIEQIGTSDTYYPVAHTSMEISTEWRKYGDFVVREYSGLALQKVLDVAYATEPMLTDPAPGEFLDFSRVARYAEEQSVTGIIEPAQILTEIEREYILQSVITSQGYEGIIVPTELASRWLDEVLADPPPTID